MLAINRPTHLLRQKAMDAMACFLQHYSHLQIKCVDSAEEFNQVRAFRLQLYNKKLSYMLNQLDELGTDAFDSRSLVFAIWCGESVVASVRLTPYPFEIRRYVDDECLTNFLGAAWQTSYLEWSRLLIDSSCQVKGLVNVLMIYSGLYVLANTNYTNYFGYTKPHVKRLLSRFQLVNSSMSFSIPSRGKHEYRLLKGSFVDDFHNLINKTEKT